jgi:hypothetical protein
VRTNDAYCPHSNLALLQVWLVRMNDHVCPLPIRAREEEDEDAFVERRETNLEEERRLAYVGVSRARKHLQVLYLLFVLLTREMTRSVSIPVYGCVLYVLLQLESVASIYSNVCKHDHGLLSCSVSGMRHRMYHPHAQLHASLFIKSSQTAFVLNFQPSHHACVMTNALALFSDFMDQ